MENITKNISKNNESADGIRLQKFFTEIGLFSRRTAEEKIKAGYVKVNGVTAMLGDKVNPESDIVELYGKRVYWKVQKPITIMLNKPKGYVTTASDEKGRKTVLDLVKGCNRRVYPIGRLDMDSDGLLLLTSDGDLANKLMHPRNHLGKVYAVEVKEQLKTENLTILSNPMTIDGYEIKPVIVKKAGPTELLITLYEGRNRQIRKMCEQANLTVKNLTRIAYGPLNLDVPEGKWRELTQKEVNRLVNETC